MVRRQASNLFVSYAAITLLGGLHQSAHADVPGSSATVMADPTRVVTIDPVELVVGKISAHYEQAMRPTGALAVGLSGSRMGFFDYAYTTLGADVSWRWFFLQRALHGLYVAPVLLTEFDDASSSSNRTWGISAGVTAEAGYQWIWSQGFVLDLAAGWGWISGAGHVSTANSDVTLPDAGMTPTFRLAIGWAWP